MARRAVVIVASTPTYTDIAGRLSARLASGALVNVDGINADGSAQLTIFGGSYETTVCTRNPASSTRSS